MVWAMLVIASEAPFKTLMGSFIACEKTPFMGVARNQMAFREAVIYVLADFVR